MNKIEELQRELKGDKKITVMYETDNQLAILSALVQSFESGGVNMDKFLFWALNTVGAGNSICLRQLTAHRKEERAMNIVERAKAKWNKQADEYNQWIHLGTEEKLDLIIAEESSNHALLEDMAEVLQKLYDHTKNNMQICGLNSIASSVLTRYDIARAKERLGK